MLRLYLRTWHILVLLVLAASFTRTAEPLSAAPRLAPADCKARVEAYERNPYPVNFTQGQCTYYAMTQRRDLEVLNYYQQTCLSSRLWNGGLWTTRLTEQLSNGKTLPQSFREDMGREWYWQISDTPQVGATAHWESCDGYSTHVAIVTDFDATSLTVLQDNVPFGATNGTQNIPQTVNRASCIRYIYPVEVRNPPPTIQEQSTRVSFSIRWPIRWISVSTPYRFEVRLDSSPTVILSGAENSNPANGRKIFLLPGAHTATIKYWAPNGSPAPRFSQEAMIVDRVVAEEPSPDTPLPIEYSLVANPSVAQSGDRVTLAYSAREPATNQPIAAVEVFINDQSMNRSSGARGSWTWQTNNIGRFRVRLQARVDGASSVQSKEFEYSVQARVPAPSGPAAYIGFAYPLAQADWRESQVPISFGIAQSAVESGWGSSGLATNYNNYFGIKCPGVPAPSRCISMSGADWRAYASARDSFLDHGRFLRQNSRYQPAFQFTNDSVSFAREVAKAGYAGANWEPYFNQIKQIMDDYNLYQYDQNGAPPPTPTPPPVVRPGKPTLTSPGNNATIAQTVEVTLAWNAATNAARYHIELWGGPYSTMTPCDNTSATSCRIGTMYPGVMSWRVQAINASGQSGDWSDTWLFTVQQNTPPTFTPTPTNTPMPPSANRPTLSSPGNGASMPQSTDVTLSWNGAVNATQYKVELWGGPYSTMTPCNWQGGTTCRIGTMWSGTMSWHVKARTADGRESDWSDTWSFTIQPIVVPTFTPTPTLVPPSANRPTLSSPGNGASMSQSTDVTLVWNGAANATQYKVELWGGPYSTMTPCNWQSGTTCRIGTMWSGTMSWHAKARNASGQETDWSDTWSFTIQQPVSTPTPTMTPKPTTPGRAILTQGLVISPSSPTAGQNVNAKFKIKNDGGQPITLRYFGVKGRHSSGASYDFLWIENFTLQPGQEFQYDVNRALDRTGSYTFTPNYYDGANWSDLKFANGSTSYITINVR